MSVIRHAPRRWWGAGVLLGLGFVLGLLASGVIAQLSGGPGSTAQAAEATAQTPAPGPTPTPTDTSAPTPSSSTSPTPTATPVEALEEDDDGPEPIEPGAAPRSPRTPRSAQMSEGTDGGSGAPAAQNLIVAPGEATAAEISAAQTVIQGPVYVTIVYQDRIDIEIEQDSEGESGDALAASQAIGAVTGGQTTINGHNTSGGGGGSVAESGAALAANSIEVTGPFVNGGIDWSDVAIAGPVSWSVVFEDDVDVKFKQKGEAASGAALADSQLFGVSSRGDVNIGAWNNTMGGGGGGDSAARSGDASVNNAIDIRSPLIVGDFVLDGSTLNGDLVQSVTYLDDYEISFKQSFLSLSGISAAATQYLQDLRAGGDVNLVLDNAGAGESRSGDSSGTNLADAGSNAGSTVETTPAATSNGTASSNGTAETAEPAPTQRPADVRAPETQPASAEAPGIGMAQFGLLAGLLAFGLGRRRRGRG